jgi:HPt (histidine-containing phosphotransfer) domain-containing protein
MREMYLENGFNDFLSKPIDTAKLDSTLKRWIPEDKRRSVSTAEPEASPRAPSPRHQIAGLDMEAGLARIGGSRSRYLDLLDLFRRDVEAGSALLDRGPDGDLRSFTTLVHALKSALANIGADCLSEAAGELERAGLEADLEAIGDGLPSFRDALASLTRCIGEFTEAERSEGSDQPPSPLTAEVLISLREALAARDVEAMDSALARLRSLNLNRETQATISEIDDLVLEAEFEKAESLVNDFLKELQQ